MATFQGAAFLPDQLASIEQQTLPSWRLIARDDGSTDGTRRILAEFAAKHGDRVTLLSSDGQRLGPAGNFSVILTAATAPFVALADQDDVWAPDKLEVLAARAQRAGAGESADPYVVHSDLAVVDTDLSEIAPSLVRYQGLGYGLQGPLSRLLVQSHATGCAMLMNRALVRRAIPIPSDAVMHDAWLALVAVAFGRVEFEPRALMRYRQHDASELGARRHGAAAIAALARDRKRSQEAIAAKMRQARAFYERFASELEPNAERVLTTFLSLPEMAIWSRWRAMRREGLVASDPWRTAGLALFS